MSAEQMQAIIPLREKYSWVDPEVILCKKVIDAVESYNDTHLVRHAYDNIQAVFHLYGDTIQQQNVRKYQLQLHKAYNDLLYLLNRNHTPNNDPSGFIHEYNACRLVLYNGSNSALVKQDFYPRPEVMMSELAYNLKDANYYGFYYDAQQQAKQLTQRVGIAMIEANTRDITMTVTGLSRMDDVQNPHNRPQFGIIQESNNQQRESKILRVVDSITGLFQYYDPDGNRIF